MNQEEEHFLNPKNPPGRLTKKQAGWLLGFKEDEMSVLLAKKLLKSLGHPAANGPKYFLASKLEELRRDEQWYGRASDAVREYWRDKNARKGIQVANGSTSQRECAEVSGCE